MAEAFHLKQNEDNDSLCQFLSDETSQNPFHLKFSLGRSISAPPVGLIEFPEASGDLKINEEKDVSATKEYYDYYHSLKPRDPRLPIPTWKPTINDQYNKNLNQENSQFEDETFASQFDQSVNVNTTQDSQTMESTQSQATSHYPRGSNHQYSNHGNGNHYRNQNNNYGRRGNYSNNGFNNQSRQNIYQQQRSNKQQNNPHNKNDQQGQVYHQNYQAGNTYNSVPYMNQQAYYGNPYQNQSFSYMDPSMNYSYYANPMMGQMPVVNPMFMNQNYNMYNYPQQNTQMPVQGTYQNNYQAGGSQYQKNKKPIGKSNRQGSQFNQNYTPYQKQNIEDVLQNVLMNSRDQHGSRLIQQYFEQANEEERENIYNEIQPELLDLMTDVFGNYVVQKILDLGDSHQKLGIVKAAMGNMCRLSQNTYSCRIIQKLLEEFKDAPEIQDPFFDEISAETLPLIEDANGNHVIQKCFETVPIDKLQFIIDEVAKKVDILAFHSYGCRVIQKILECSPRERLNQLYENLMKYALQCCQCQYGNYIMQYLLEKGPSAEKEMLFNLLKKNFIKLSLSKFASNVTEKSVKYGHQDYIQDVIHVLINNYHDNKIGLVALMTHDYGNYVIQKLFDSSNETGKRLMYDRIRQENVDEIKKNNYGKHVMTFIENWMENQKVQKI